MPNVMSNAQCYLGMVQSGRLSPADMLKVLQLCRGGSREVAAAIIERIQWGVLSVDAIIQLMEDSRNREVINAGMERIDTGKITSAQALRLIKLGLMGGPSAICKMIRDGKYAFSNTELLAIIGIYYDTPKIVKAVYNKIVEG